MKILAHAVGGFANMMNTLVIATFLSKTMKIPLYINWFKTDQCQCDLQDIFTYNCVDIHIYDGEPVGEHILKLWKPSRASYDDQMKDLVYKQESFVNLNDFKNSADLISHIKSTKSDSIYVSEVVVPSFISYFPFFSSFKFKKELLSSIPAHILDSVSLGFHIRGTDTLSKYKVSHDSIRNCLTHLLENHKCIFVASDDADIFKICREFEGIMTNSNQHCVVKKREDLKWMNLGQQGHSNIFNVYRARDQVLEGIVDLLTLASIPKIQGFITSRESTYYDLAFKIQNHRSLVFDTTRNTTVKHL
jgi:hypothetical protein